MSSIFPKKRIKNNFLIFSWGLYDLANQVFALNIVSLYFVRWVIIDKQIPELFYGLSFGLSSIMVACLAPFLGAISDLANKHRLFLTIFTLISIAFTIGLGLIEGVIFCLVFFAFYPVFYTDTG